MTPETETSSTSAASNGGDGSDAKTTHDSDMTSKSIARNGGRGRGRGGRIRRGGHQVCGGQGLRLKRLEYTLIYQKLQGRS